MPASSPAELLTQEQRRTMARERRANAERYELVQFVSLGEQCLPRLFLSRWGFKPVRADGESSGPFDLAVHPVEDAVTLLQQDFDGYLDEIEYVPEAQVVVSTRTGVKFNHEVGPEYGADGCRLLRETYERRTEVLRGQLASTRPTVFVWANGFSRHGLEPQLVALAEEVFSRRGGRPAAFLALQLVDAGDPLPDELTGTPADLTTMTVARNLPYPGYVWHEPLHCFSPEGFAFEHDLALTIDATLRPLLEAWSEHVAPGRSGAPPAAAGTASTGTSPGPSLT